MSADNVEAGFHEERIVELKLEIEVVEDDRRDAGTEPLEPSAIIPPSGPGSGDPPPE